MQRNFALSTNQVQTSYNRVTKRMKRAFFNEKSTYKMWLCVLFAILMTTPICGQIGGDITTDELAEMGFENVRWTETENERIYTVENTAYKLNGVGIAKALDVIQKGGLPEGKTCRLIVTKLNIPQISLTCATTVSADTTQANREDWNVSYELGDSWKEVKKEKKKNSSLFKVDILIYPQLSFKNYIITQIYQALFTLNPAIEVSLWEGMKLTAQLKVPIYNDGYGYLEDEVHPAHLTISQRFRLPYNIFGKATIGYFNQDRYGFDLQFMRPFKDERFSLEARVGYTGIGYWNKFHLHYDKDMFFSWTLGGSFYWPQYNTQFTLKAQQFLLEEKGVMFEMIRHFRYASIGFYACKAENANSNGGFMFQVALPPYKQKRHKYLPRISTSKNMGIKYNAGNERKYYKEYIAEPSDNIMENYSLNPYFIKSELTNY